MVHKQWLKVSFLTSQMPVLSGRINSVSFSTTWIFCFPKIPIKYSKKCQKFAMSKNISNMLFKTCWTLCKKPHLSTWSRSRYTFFWMTRYRLDSGVVGSDIATTLTWCNRCSILGRSSKIFQVGRRRKMQHEGWAHSSPVNRDSFLLLPFAGTVQYRVIVGLYPDTEYDFNITAINADGPGPTFHTYERTRPDGEPIVLRSLNKWSEWMNKWIFIPSFITLIICLPQENTFQMRRLISKRGRVRP